MPIMIWLAIIIEFAIQNWIDAGILLGIQFANATLGWCVRRQPGAARLPDAACVVCSPPSGRVCGVPMHYHLRAVHA